MIDFEAQKVAKRKFLDISKEKANAEWRADVARANAPKPTDTSLTDAECKIIRQAVRDLGKSATADILCMSIGGVIATLAGIGNRASTITRLREKLPELKGALK